MNLVFQFQTDKIINDSGDDDDDDDYVDNDNNDVHCRPTISSVLTLSALTGLLFYIHTYLYV